MTTGRTIALTRQTFVGNVMSLLFNVLSRLVIAFLPRSKRLLISWLQSPSAMILESEKIRSLTISIISPSICHEMMVPDAMILVFWMLSFKTTFSLSSFTFTKRLFSSSSLSVIRVVSSAYLRLLIFLLASLIPACASSTLAFHMMYSAYKLCKQGDNIQPRCKEVIGEGQFITFCWRGEFNTIKHSFTKSFLLATMIWCHHEGIYYFSRFVGFPGGSEGKASACNAGDLGSIPGLGTSLKKEMATHSSTLAWKIPWTEEPGRLQCMGSQSHTWLSNFT